MSYHATGHSYAQACAERGELAPIRVGRGCRFGLHGGMRFGYVVEIDDDALTIACAREDGSAYLTIRTLAEVVGPEMGSLEAASTIPAALRARVERRLGYAVEVAA